MVGCLSTVPVLSSIAALGWVWGGAVKHSLPKGGGRHNIPVKAADIDT